MDGSLVRRGEAAAAAAQAAYAAAAAVTSRLSSAAPHDLCVVCLQPCATKACACSFMHEQCAASYANSYGTPRCRVCSGEFDSEKLSKRPRDNDEDAAISERAHKRRREREAYEHGLNLEWARRVAPCAAQILFRHFQHIRNESHHVQPTFELSFDAIVLSLLHSGPEYLDDLSERLSDTMSGAEVDHHLRRLHLIGDALSSPERIGEECLSEFMRLFNAHFDRRLLAGGHIPVEAAPPVVNPVDSTPA
ncbi:hypothetical protein AB1Y20_001830 [Prymnesium parvum]|uniref:RING-type domain-containing protein n=1 Tax=Prymnesium parvum TaxID=97485 RepID=A0AB34K8W8_PRYPA